MSTIAYTFWDEEAETDIEVQLPAKYKVCGRCQGSGSHDCWEGGMTGDEMAEQGPEFIDDYLSGMYSVPCTTCRGQRVVLVVDRPMLSEGQRIRFDAAEREKREMEAEMAHEQRMGY